MAESLRRAAYWANSPLCQGTLLLVLLITAFLYKPLFTDEILISSDILYESDPLWQPLTPAGFTASENGAVSDQFALFYPWQAYARAAFAQGHFALWEPPLWNPYVNSGHPFVGNLQSAIFDPLHMLSFLVPFPQSLSVLSWLRLFVAGFFTLCLALELGLSRRAAYLAMLVFTFAMPQIVWLGFTKASVLAWLPALWFLSARIIRRSEWRDVVWLGVVTAAQLVGGHPEGSIYVELAWGTFALYGLWYLWRQKKQPVLLATMQLGLGCLFGLALAAIQLLPAFETILQGQTLAVRNHIVLNWKTLFFQWDEWVGGITLVLPNFFGNPRFDTYWFPHSYSNFNEQNFFMGVTALALALLALCTTRFAKRDEPMLEQTSSLYPTSSSGQNNFWQTTALWDGPGAYFVWLGIIGTGLALSLPGFTLLAQMPGLHLLSPARWRGIVLLAVALLAGYGLDRYLVALTSIVSEQKILRRWAWVVLVLAVGSALGSLATWALLYFNYDKVLALGQAQIDVVGTNPLSFRTKEEYLTLAIQRLGHLMMTLQPTYWPTYLPLWIALLILGVQHLLLRWMIVARHRNTIMGGLLLLIVLGELWGVAYDYNPAIAREDVFPTPALIEELRQHTAANSAAQSVPFRVVGMNRVLSPNVNMVFALEDVRGYEPSGAARYFQLMARVDGAIPLYPILLFRHAQSPILDFLNVRYAFSDVPLNAPWQLIAKEGAVGLYANPEVLPRAFLVYAAQPARSANESLSLTLDPNFDIRHNVVIEVTDDAEAEALASLQPPSSPGRSMITHYAPGEITVDVTSDGEGILVLSESYLSGWKATIDGVDAPLYVANHAFHAIRVPAGDHTVTFTYAPTSVTIGAWISIGSLLLLLGLLVWPRRKRTIDSAETPPQHSID